MKKICLILFAFLILFSACGKKESFELALITDFGNIDDKSFNQGSWEGICQYAEENNVTYKYYKSPEQGYDAYMSIIDLAIKGGAKIVITPGIPFAAPVFTSQDLYPDVHFILIDCEANDGGRPPVYKTSSNAVNILYAEEQAGFLAGYSAVRDGYRELGFIGGMAFPAVVRFGYGFIQGAEFAAQELALASGSVSVHYTYTGSFQPSPETQTLAASWYNSGVEVIFACGGKMGSSVVSAAEQTGKKVIGVDKDQSEESDTIITSAMKVLQYSVYSCIADYYAGRWPGGRSIVFSADNDGVGLPMETSKFRIFTEAQYNDVYQKLAGGEISVMKNVENVISPDVVPVTITRVIEIK